MQFGKYQTIKIVIFSLKILLEVHKYKNDFLQIANKNLQIPKKITYLLNSQAKAISKQSQTLINLS